MDYSVGAAIGAGLVGAAAMLVPLYMGILMFPRQMTMNILYILGTMMGTRHKAMAYTVGVEMHAVMGIAFGLAHAGVFLGLDIDSNEAAWGLLFGFGHWIIVGMGLGMMGIMHPRMRSGELPAPGAYAKDSPPMTMMGFLMLHLLFGVVVGVLYAAWN